MSESAALSGPNSRLSARRTMANGVFLVASSPQGSDPRAAATEAYTRIADTLSLEQMKIVHERVFGSLGVEPVIREARRDALQSREIPADGPLTCLQGHPTWGEGFAGVIVRAVPTGRNDDQVRVIFEGTEPRGRTWCADGLRYIALQNIQGLIEDADADNAPASQAGRAMDRADRLLRGNGSSYRNTARTWFYLSDILDWYGRFNQVRNAKYDTWGLLPGPGENSSKLPASTGIRAELPGGAACALDLLAVSSLGGSEPTVRHIRNPRQKEAFRYGSAFSRCAVIQGRREKLIEVSGTAAIDEAGKSLYLGDARLQARCTLEKLTSLLEPVGASLEDICAATIFLKNGDDAPLVREELADLGLGQLPAVWVVADVCRDDLLFEIDAEVVVA